VERLKALKAIMPANDHVAGLPQSAEAPHVGEILSVCLNGFEAISTCLLSVLPPEDEGSATSFKRSNHFKAGQSPDSPDSPGFPNPSFGLPPPFLENKFVQLVRQFFTTIRIPPSPTGLIGIARLGRNFLSTAVSKSFGGHMLEHDGPIEPEPKEARLPVTREAVENQPIPLIKAGTLTGSRVTPSPRQFSQQSCAGKQGCTYDFDGRCILCVGGQSALYPEYRKVVEASGGKLMFYRNPPKGSEAQLPALLARADMVVCPVDCVNHCAFFAVKRYCRQSGKPCVLLERSSLPTFRKGIATLAEVTGLSAGKGQSVHSAKSFGAAPDATSGCPHAAPFHSLEQRSRSRISQRR
jgi:hypothetical protein